MTTERNVIIQVPEINLYAFTIAHLFTAISA